MFPEHLLAPKTTAIAKRSNPALASLQAYERSHPQDPTAPLVSRPSCNQNVAQHTREEHWCPGMAAETQAVTTSAFWGEGIPAQVKGCLQASERGREEAEG